MTNTRDQLTFYACDGCGTTGADSDARLNAGDRLLRTSRESLQHAKQRIRESHDRLRKKNP